MKSIVLSFVLVFSLALANINAQELEMNSKSFSKEYYYQGKEVSKQRFALILSSYPQSKKLWYAAETNSVIGSLSILATPIVAGVIATKKTVLGHTIFDEDKFVIITGGGALLGLIISMTAVKQRKKAINLYNGYSRAKKKHITPSIGTTQNGVGLILSF